MKTLVEAYSTLSFSIVEFVQVAGKEPVLQILSGGLEIFVKSQTENTALLDEWQHIAFGAALVTRMMPNYALFSDLTGIGNSVAYNNILSLVWEYASGDNPNIDFDKQQDKLEAITPDPDQCDVYGVWPALDAVVALASLLSACERFDRDEVDSIVLLSESTIVSFLEATAADGEYKEHPLFAANKQFCWEALQRLGESVNTTGRKRAVKSIKNWALEFEDSNIGLVLMPN